jgi:hypothetical protein
MGLQRSNMQVIPVLVEGASHPAEATPAKAGSTTSTTDS